ncbi:MAG: hemerythrin-like metal-binding protein [Puniceicoccaceae bacterium 5H]|nr:MAG: hemerythrin-like metal-binding protein [Puniceicoccaceae bacterium 5H]
MSLHWNERYATGHARVDDQHKSLFAYLNDLERLIQRREYASPAVENLIRSLGVYVRIHFACEESCMEIHQCPNPEKNKEQHQIFLREFTAFRDAWRREGPSLERLQMLHRASESWIVQHIFKIDQELGQTLVARGYNPEREAHIRWEAVAE